jgi:hypothetical protein
VIDIDQPALPVRRFKRSTAELARVERALAIKLPPYVK